MGYEVNLDGDDFDFTVDNSTVNLFRKQPDFDYVTYKQGEEYTAIFNGTLTRWLGGLALTSLTQRELRDSERTHGSYAEQFGGNPRVIIDDHPSPYEFNMYVQTLLDDINEIPEWMGDGN